MNDDGVVGTREAAAILGVHRSTLNDRRVSGNVPCSMYLTQVRLTPIGTECSLLQATVQA